MTSLLYLEDPPPFFTLGAGAPRGACLLDLGVVLSNEGDNHKNLLGWAIKGTLQSEVAHHASRR